MCKCYGGPVIISLNIICNFKQINTTQYWKPNSLHVLLDVPPALADLEEDGRVAADDDDARHQEGQHHQELLRRAPVLPANKWTEM